MDEIIIDLILKCVPFSGWFEAMGFTKEMSALLSAFIVIVLGVLLVKGVKRLYRRWVDGNAAKVLDPQFDYAAIKKATEIYIPTQYQNASPSRQDEPGFTHQYVSRSELIPFFINNAFKVQSESERFYLILADSGMGKTTFMVNLYLRYHSFFNTNKKYKMRLFRFSHEDTWEQVKKIPYEEARHTILLLDALDEDPFIVSKDPEVTDAAAFKKRVDDIINTTRNFAEVLMTCRTQYFPGQETDPYELKLKRPDEKGFYTLNKLYLSPFNDDEVGKYLKKKYSYLPFINREKKKRAKQVIGQAKHLVMRPMMLSYIDLLVEDKFTFTTDYSIYNALIKKWLRREADKRKYKEADRKVFIENLRQVSQQTAIAIWEKWNEEKRNYLTKEEAVNIAKHNNLTLKAEEVTGQSLLTCDGAGNWKFAHKSIWEFFLAKEAIEKGPAFMGLNFAGMDMTHQFFKEFMPSFTFVKGGEFLMGSPPDEPEREEIELQHPVKVSDFHISTTPITLAQFERFIKETGYRTDADKEGHSRSWTGKKWIDKPGVNWRCDISGKPQTEKDHPVIHVSWNDGMAYAYWLGEKWDIICRLPYEAEWEFAARGGNQSKGFIYSGSNDIEEVAWYRKNSDKKTHPVSEKKPNELGLYDMTGNVWEWCHDWYDEKYYEECKAKGTIENPIGPANGKYHLLRGGSWDFDAPRCRSALRDYDVPAHRVDNIGFRLVSVL